MKLLSSLSKPLDGAKALTALMVFVCVLLPLAGAGTISVGGILITELVLAVLIYAVNSRPGKTFLAFCSKVIEKVTLVFVIAALVALLLWGVVTLYTVTSLKLIILLGIIAIVLAIVLTRKKEA
jgi:hypothetical protein